MSDNMEHDYCHHHNEKLFETSVAVEPHHCLPYQSESTSEFRKNVKFHEPDYNGLRQAINEDDCQYACNPHHYDEQKPMPSDIPEPPIIEREFRTDSDENHLVCDAPTELPSYLPQPNDTQLEMKADQLKVMGPIGPWATGKVDWSPMSGLTGVRPIVDRYSITRYSPAEWRRNNNELLTKANEAYQIERINSNNCKSIKSKAYDVVHKNQIESNNRLRSRTKLVDNWKNTLERAIKAHIDEICALEQERLRVKKSLAILNLPQSIASECLEKRTTRPDSELVRDGPEEELIKEIALIKEIRLILNKTLADVEQQQIENRAARHRLENDWSDKQEAYRIELITVELDNLSNTTLFKPGSTKFPADQSSEEYWEQFTRETLEECEKCRQKSIKLRSTLNEILMNAARDLRTQGDAVEKSLTDRISCMRAVLIRLENELVQSLRKLADTENRIEKLKTSIQNLDNAMKVAQTRLDNRHNRPNVENCRDYALKGLIDEVKMIQESVTAMLATLNETEQIKERLMELRVNLEKEIMLKRRAIAIDIEYCMMLRSYFPSASALTGFTRM